MGIEKWITAAVVCFVSVPGARGGQNKNSSVANPYKVYCVGMNAEFTPFEPRTSEGNMEGFDVDLMNAMAKAGNFKVELKHQPWKSLLPSLGNGDIDITISGVIITNERKQSMDFGDPYFEITQVVLVPKGKEVASSDDLKNTAKVGVVTSRTGDSPVSKLLGSNNLKISRFETVPLIIKELENGELGSVVNDSAVTASYVKSNPTKGLDFITLPDFSTENYGITAHKGDEVAVEIPNGTLKKVREGGECGKIYTKYFAREEVRTGKVKKTK